MNNPKTRRVSIILALLAVLGVWIYYLDTALERKFKEVNSDETWVGSVGYLELEDGPGILEIGTDLSEEDLSRVDVCKAGMTFIELEDLDVSSVQVLDSDGGLIQDSGALQTCGDFGG